MHSAGAKAPPWSLLFAAPDTATPEAPSSNIYRDLGSLAVNTSSSSSSTSSSRPLLRLYTSWTSVGTQPTHPILVSVSVVSVSSARSLGQPEQEPEPEPATQPTGNLFQRQNPLDELRQSRDPAPAFTLISLTSQERSSNPRSASINTSRFPSWQATPSSGECAASVCFFRALLQADARI